MEFKDGIYNDIKWTIYNEDCIQILSKVIYENSIDCIITSPPYFQKRIYNKNGKELGNRAKYSIKKYNKFEANINEIGNCKNINDYIVELEDVLKGCYRVLKKDKFLFLNINKIRKEKRTIDISGKIIESAERVGFIHRDTIIWIKENPTPLAPNASQYYLWDGWEYILLFTKGTPKLDLGKFVNNSKNIQCKSCGNTMKYIKNGKPNYFLSYVGFYGNKKEHKKKNHQGVFPPTLPIYAFSIATKEGDTILDPFSGSGTTLIEGLKGKRNVIGCELHKNIYEDLIRRIENI